MTFDEYQAQTRRTMNMHLDDDPAMKLATMAMGLAGEAGEVVDLLKKHLGHGHPLELDKLERELGDVLWYVSAIATLTGTRMDTAAASNLEKLRKRYPDGFTSEASINRTE